MTMSISLDNALNYIEPIPQKISSSLTSAEMFLEPYVSKGEIFLDIAGVLPFVSTASGCYRIGLGAIELFVGASHLAFWKLDAAIKDRKEGQKEGYKTGKRR